MEYNWIYISIPGIPPPIPPPISGIGGMSFFSSGKSAITASAVINNPATEAESWIAERTTLVGSIIPSLTRSVNFPVWAL